MPILELLHTTTFDADMDRLRIACFPEEGWGHTACDDYDRKSTHLAFRADGTLAGYGRLTPGRYGYFRRKFGPDLELPPADESVDLGRIVVAPAHRGHLLFELILLEGLLVAAKGGCGFVVGSSRPDRKFRPLLHELGFVDCGSPVQVSNNAQVCFLQAVVAPTLGRVPEWLARKSSLITRFREMGYEVAEPDGRAEPHPAATM